MSAPSPGQLRPNSAIYLGAAAPIDDQQSTPPNSNLPLLSPGGTTVLGRIPHLPSPPHTSSTSGSAGEREKEGGGQAAGNIVSDIEGPGSKQRIILPAVVIMQNGGQDYHGFDNDPKRNYHQQQHFEQDQEDRTARIPPKRSLAEKNKEILDKLDRFSTLGNGRSPGGIMSPASRTISLGRASSASAAAATAATNSMRHASMTLPPRESRERDVFDRDDHHSSSGRSHSASNSLSVPHSHSTNSNSDMDDRSTTPPATPAKRLIELSQNSGSTNSSPQRKRLVSEPTSPQRLAFLRDRTPNRLSESAVNLSSPLNNNANLSSPLSRGSPLNNTVGRSSTVNSPGSSSLRRMTTLNRSELGTVEEDRDRRSPATRKARTPIPFEFLGTADQELQPPDSTGDRSRQPSPGLYTSEGAPTSPGLYISEDTGGTRSGSITGSIRSTRRPRPPGIRSSIDRSYEQWEREQMGDGGSNVSPSQPSHESGPETSGIRRAGSAVGVGVRSVVNEGLRAAGLTRPRKVSGSGSGTGAVVASPTVIQSRERMDSLDMTRTGSMRLSSERDRSRSRLSVDDQREREPVDMDSLRERASRNAFFSPNVRGTRTIYNVLNPGADGPSPGEEQGAIIPASGRETPANLRLFKANYSSTINNSTPALKAYTSPSGTQRHIPSRSVTALNMANHGNDSHSHNGTNSPRMPGTPSPMKNSISLGSTSNQSSPSTVNGAGPVNLLQDALWMFESHVQRLPPSNAPEITNDVLRDARGIVQAAVALNGALRGAATVSVDEQIDAETDGDNGAGAADVWRRVGAEFREDARVADELVRALTSFMIGAGRMLRVSSANAGHSGHGRMGSINGGEGSVSRAGGSALARGSSVSRAGGSSDGRRSVEGWSLGIGMSGAERRSIDGRRSVEPGAYPGSRRSADDYREDTMRRLTARQGTNDAGSNGSGGSRDRPNTSTGAHRVSFQAYGSGSDSRPTTSLSMRRDLPRISHDEPLVSPGLRTFTSLSSRRSTGHPTPAMGNHKALPRLPIPPQQTGAGGELYFPQSEDGGDRTPIELPRPHMRHSTMPALAVPLPLPTLPSEHLINRAKSIGKHAASTSITSASTTSTTRPPLPTSSATVRGSSIIPATGSSSIATTAVTPTTARPREMSFSGNDPSTSPFSMGRARGSAAVNGLQQVALGNPPRKRTISNADEEYSEEDPRTARLPPANSSSSMAKSGSVSGLGFPSSGSGSPGGNGSTPFEPRRSSVRPVANRRTSSTLSGASTSTITSSVMTANATTPARHRAVTRMSSAGALTLSNPNLNGSRGSLASAGGSGGETRGSVTDGAEEERKLRRSRVRLSLNAMMDKRGGIGELLGGSGRRLTAHVAIGGGRSAALEGDEADVGESPSLSARERRERRRVAEGV